MYDDLKTYLADHDSWNTVSERLLGLCPYGGTGWDSDAILVDECYAFIKQEV